ncbi:MAG: SOS response-associated peptidase, partial [Anaerolineae bacterium]|nr:SOS response-associated peptidase [Anaerolineae bacterium]
SWAKDPTIGSRMINARSETVAEKPSFRSAFKSRRCLVPADGFYEWQRQERGKQPFFIRMSEGTPFAIAGLWEHWQGPEGEVIESCTLLTTEANEMMRPLHDRMPVILDPKDYDLWLDPGVQKREILLPLFRPYASEAMIAYPVRPVVNSPANDSPLCIEPLT